MSYDYSENILVQESAGNLLQNVSVRMAPLVVRATVIFCSRATSEMR